jgi:hypothetical protein
MKKVLFVIIAILLAVVIFFCGVLVNQNTQSNIIKQLEEVAKQATEASSDNGYITIKDHLSEMNSLNNNNSGNGTKNESDGVWKITYSGRGGSCTYSTGCKSTDDLTLNITINVDNGVVSISDATLNSVMTLTYPGYWSCTGTKNTTKASFAIASVGDTSDGVWKITYSGRAGSATYSTGCNTTDDVTLSITIKVYNEVVTISDASLKSVVNLAYPGYWSCSNTTNTNKGSFAITKVEE